MTSGTRITCEDLESGETETRVIRDDWVVITDGKYEVASLSQYANGTAVVTVKATRHQAEAQEC